MNDQDLRRLIEPDAGLPEERHTYLKEQLMTTILTGDQTQADGSDPTRPRVTSRRRKMLVGAAVATLSITGAVAAATTGVLFPDDNELLPVDACRTESSIQEAVASMQRDNGNTLTLFTTRSTPDAPINGEALVETTPDGQTVGGVSGCNLPGSERSDRGEFWLAWDGDISADSEVFWPYGKAPQGATSVEIDFDRGETLRLDVHDNGYFVGELNRTGTGSAPGPGDGYDPHPTTIRALDSDGNLVDEQHQ